MKNIICLLLLSIVSFACDFEKTVENDVGSDIFDFFRSLSFWLGIILIFWSMFINKYKRLVFFTGYCITIVSAAVSFVLLIEGNPNYSFLYYIDKFDGIVNLFKHFFLK